MEERGGIGASLNASELCYAAVDNEGKLKRILRNVSFSLGSGTLSALMGPSGAGKSTLLDLLAARKLVGTWSGTIQVDDKPRSRYFSRETAYVMQDRILISTLTTEETIRYAARTMLPEGTSSAELQQRVELVMEMLKLTHVRSSRVGDAMSKGISGGQAKRLSIAVEIVALPRLIFLDEPTSGLDSSIAFEVMSTVREITGKSVTCVCTIHQPSREIFALFDQLLLVSAGRLIYAGPASEAVTYFTQPALGYSFAGGRCNPAEFVIEVSCGQRLPEGLAMPRQPAELEALYKSSRYYQPVKLSERAMAAEEYIVPYNEAWSLYGSDRYVTSQWTQFAMLMERSWVMRIRDTADLRAQFTKYAAITVLFGLVYWQAGEKLSTPFYVNGLITSEATRVNSFLYFFTTTAIRSNAFTIPQIRHRAPLYHRELASCMYAPMPYWLSTFLTSLPTQLGFHLVTCCLVYPMVGLNSNANVFCYFVFMTYLVNMVTTAASLAIAAGTDSVTIAMTRFNLMFLLLNTFSGYFIQYDQVPSYWQWATYVAYSKWIFEGLMVNEWNQYDTDDLPGDDGTSSGDVLSDFNFGDFDAANAIWIALLFAAVFLSMAYYFLLPPKTRLIKVSDAADTANLTGASKPTLKIPSGAKRAKGSAGSDLQTSLLSDNGVMEENPVDDEPFLQPEQKLSVQSFKRSTGAIDQAQGCRLVFTDLHFALPGTTPKDPELMLLKGVTGRAKPGEMVALMGASGAGKSTLLDVLAQRKSTGRVSGVITYNDGADVPPSAYVMQDDVHIGTLTVRESIYFAAELRLSMSMSAATKAKRVDKIIDMLALGKVADSILGSQTVRGISGGELKRVSIGVEIVHLPGLMFLDEPTTGLDSSIALEVISAVRNLANQNRTVICTIHQPSEDTFELFDTMLLLAEGRVVYFGPAVSAAEYFTQSPFHFARNPGANPADFIIAVAGSFLPAQDGRSITAGELHTYYVTTGHAQVAAQMIYTPSVSALGSPSASATGASAPYTVNTNTPPAQTPQPTTVWHQFTTLTHRRWLSMRREINPILAQLAADVLTGFLFGSLYYKLDTGDSCDAGCYENRMSVLYSSVLALVMGRLTMAAGMFQDRLVYYRERGNKAYGPLPYCLSVLTSRMPLTVLSVLCYSLFLYPMAGLRSGGHYGTFFIVLVLVGFCGLLLAYACIAISSSYAVVLSYFPAMMTFFMFYSGYVVYIPVMPDWQRTWMPYLSMQRYAFQGLMLNEFQNNDDLPQAQEYINQLGFNVISIQGCCGALLLWIVVLVTLFYIATKYVNFEER